MLKEVFTQLRKPHSEKRGAPFWAWNSKLEPEELRRQIRIFKKMGLGGFFMHSRVGMATPYLSDEWFKCIDACVDEAKKQGMYAWLYDEDRWPSGAAGGLVTKNPLFRQRHLRIMIADNAEGLKREGAELIGPYYSAKIDMSNDCHDCTNLKKLSDLPAKAPKGCKLIAFYVETPPPSSWYNGQTYLDTLNKDAVHEFIKDTHEVYLEKCGNEFGKTIPGIFADEPNYCEVDTLFGGGVRPWSLHFAEEFKKRCGYDIVDHLPELFLNIDGITFSTAAYDYYKVATDMFTEAFSGQIGKWCEKHKLEFTGHALFEDDLWTQRNCIGDAMRFYEFQQRPGIDLLEERLDYIDTAKQCSSVAHQLDRPNRLCEVYGCTGWDFPFAGHKALGDWLQVLGINFRVQHLAWYSMLGEAKRDYPASISFQSSWWQEYKVVEDYFARQRVVLDPAKEIRDILVIHPIESIWGERLSMSEDERYHYCQDRLIKLRNALLESHNDFDYGCEDMLPRYTSVVKASEGEDGAPVRLKVGAARYSTVILPKMTTIRATTLDLLEKFAAEGGDVYYIDGGIPSYLNGHKDKSIGKRYRNAFKAIKLEAIAKKFKKSVNRISMTSLENEDDANCRAMLYELRECDDYQALFLVNTGMHHDSLIQESPRAVDRKIDYGTVELQWKKRDDYSHVYEVDLMTGELHDVMMHKRTKDITTTFAPLQSRLFIACKEPQNEIMPAFQAPEVCDSFEVDACFDYTLSEKNSMVLDHASYTAKCSDGRKVVCEDSCFIIRVDDKLRELLHSEHRGGSMVQPWLTANNPPPKDYIDLELNYSFDCEEVPEKDIELVMENPQLFTIELNGKKISNTPCGEWFDPCLKCLNIPAKYIVEGYNKLVLRGVYNVAQSGLEAIFLRGDFGVRGMRTMTALPPDLHVGDWCEQGLANYSGDVTYHYDFKLMPEGLDHKFMLEVPNFGGTAVGVSINGSPMQMLLSEPYVFELDNVKPDENRVDITVFGSRRNLCGPFYNKDRWPWWTGSGELKCYQVTERRLVPSGLLEAPAILVVDENLIP